MNKNVIILPLFLLLFSRGNATEDGFAGEKKFGADNDYGIIFMSPLGFPSQKQLEFLAARQTCCIAMMLENVEKKGILSEEDQKKFPGTSGYSLFLTSFYHNCLTQKGVPIEMPEAEDTSKAITSEDIQRSSNQRVADIFERMVENHAEQLLPEEQTQNYKEIRSDAVNHCKHLLPQVSYDFIGYHSCLKSTLEPLFKRMADYCNQYSIDPRISTEEEIEEKRRRAFVEASLWSIREDLKHQKNQN